jgi:carbon-monoxide dehydrogenase medium subunit
MQRSQKPALYQPETIADAVVALSALGPQGAVMAGGTWIMRAPLRHQPLAEGYVTIARIPELHMIEVTETHVKIGAGVTHDQLARELQAIPGFHALTAAAGGSANPAVRRAATVGGNLCTADFAAADLVPALLCLGAEVELRTLQDRQRVSLEAFLAMRETIQPSRLLLHVLILRRPAISAHARLPLRKAGDYPVAIVSASAERRPDGTIGNAAIATGSVERTARRWHSLEQAIAGLPLDPALIHELASGLAIEFAGREGPEAPGWYRVQVLPSLVRRAFETLSRE